MNCCEHCIYYQEVKDVNNIGKTIGVCRRYPPTVLIMPARGGVAMSSNYPNTQPHHWCGEFKSQGVLNED